MFSVLFSGFVWALLLVSTIYKAAFIDKYNCCRWFIYLLHSHSMHFHVIDDTEPETDAVPFMLTCLWGYSRCGTLLSILNHCVTVQLVIFSWHYFLLFPLRSFVLLIYTAAAHILGSSLPDLVSITGKLERTSHAWEMPILFYFSFRLLVLIFVPWFPDPLLVKLFYYASSIFAYVL